MLGMGKLVKVRDLKVSGSSNKSPSRYSTAQPHQNARQHDCHLNFPLGGIRRHIGYSFVTTIPIIHVRAAKALFDVIGSDWDAQWPNG